jgi:DNA-binding transcriptional ArsR family regulator
MNRSIFEIQADFCRAMGNATRLQMIHILREGPLSVREIARLAGFGQSFVSRQLSSLRNIGVVKFKKQGNETIYELTDSTIGEVCDLVRKVLSTQVQRQSEVFSTTDS